MHRPASSTRLVTNDAASQVDVADVLDSLAPVLLAFGTTGALAASLRTAMAEALRRASGVRPVVIAHALAELIDDRFWHSSGASFARRNP